MKFSIVIPLRKIDNYFRESVKHILKQTYKDFEVIVISESKENEKFEKTRIIRVGKISPAQKRNIGVKNSKGEILAFIDDDAYPEENWLEEANKDFENKEIVAVGGPSLIPGNATFFQRVSNKVYELSSGKTGIRYKQAGRQEIDDWPTCNFFVRKKAFEKVKGFDEKYWGGEDTQVCYALLEKGKMIYNPNLIIYHHPRKSLGKHLKQTFFWGMWRGFFMRIHPQSRQLVFFMPVFLILGLIAGAILSWFSRIVSYAYLGFILLYACYLLLQGIKTKSWRLFFPVIIVTFLTHLSYGFGFIKGISGKDEPIKKTLNPNENLKI